MQESTKDIRPGDSWDTYWRDTIDAAAYSAGETHHPVIDLFWREFCGFVRSRIKAPEILDIASGNGAVVERLREGLADLDCEFCCVDSSAAAIAKLQARFDGIRGIVADAARMPLADGSINVVTSQYGVEYAGPDGLSEAIRVVAPGGVLALLLHHAAGSIKQDCQNSLEAMHAVQESRFIPLAIEFFDAGFAAVRGADRAAYERAGSALNPAVLAVEKVLARYGAQVAGNTISRLYEDVARIHAGIQRYDPEQVLEWLRTMDIEIEAFAERMQTMCAAAMGKQQIERLLESVQSSGFEVIRAGTLEAAAGELPLGWIVVACRGTPPQQGKRP